MWSYIALYPVIGTVQCALHFTPWQACSFQHHFNFSEKHSATLQLLHQDYSFRYPSLSIARYSFIQLSELWQCGMNKIAKVSKQQQEDSNLGSLGCGCSHLTTMLPHPTNIRSGMQMGWGAGWGGVRGGVQVWWGVGWDVMRDGMLSSIHNR